jgi:hypothetical protein
MAEESGMPLAEYVEDTVTALSHAQAEDIASSI